MGSAKPVSLNVRPYQVSNLCFEGGGVLDVGIAPLGTQINPFDFTALYATLIAAPTVVGDPSRLLYGPQEIDGAVAGSILGSLRREQLKAALINSINARQNAFFAKYDPVKAAAIVGAMQQVYGPNAPPVVVQGKPQRLAILTGIASDQWISLRDAYSGDPVRNPGGANKGVVPTTHSTVCSDTSSYGYAASSGITDEFITTAPDIETVIPSPAPPDPPAPWQPPSWPTPCAGSEPSGGTGVRDGGGGGTGLPSPVPPPAAANQWGEGFKGPNDTTDTIQKGSSYLTTSTADKSRQSQVIVNTDYGFRHPYLEAAAQFERAQISLMDQQFAQFMSGQNLLNLATVFQNELNTINSNVYRLQLAYLSAILMSPIPGVITGVYKNPGDAVRPGEPVLRIENNSTVYLVATVVYRGPIVVGSVPPAPPIPNSTVTVVTTSLFGSAGVPATLTGTVVSARGRRKDDQWDLVVKCENPLDASGNPTFPLGYSFDYDDTPDVTIA